MPEYSKIHYGFTLIELMMTIAIGAIVLTLAVPSFNTVIRNDRLTTRTNELVASLNFARSEAVKRGIRVTACKSQNPNATPPTCSTSNAVNWSIGWIIFTDPNNNATFDSNTETLLRTQENPLTNITMTGSQDIANYISFVASGQSRLTNGNHQSGTIKVCDDRTGNIGVNIALNNAGRLLTQREIACP